MNIRTANSDRLQGFSILELMVVVAIVAILVAIAIPRYTSFRLRAMRGEATLTLKTIYTAQMSYFAGQTVSQPRFMLGPVGPAGNARINQALGISNTDQTAKYGYTISYSDLGVSSGQEFMVSAGKNLDSDPCGDLMMIHQSTNPMVLSSIGSPGIPFLLFDDITC